jgi:hypothetical protein
MHTRPQRVALVLDREFGGRILALAARTRVWAVDSPANRRVADRLREKDRSPEDRGGITLVEADPAATQSAACLEMLYAVESVHGPFVHNPPYGEIEVIGMEGGEADPVRAELARLGFIDFVTTQDGFRAHRRAATPRRR